MSLRHHCCTGGRHQTYASLKSTFLDASCLEMFTLWLVHICYTQYYYYYSSLEYLKRNTYCWTLLQLQENMSKNDKYFGINRRNNIKSFNLYCDNFVTRRQKLNSSDTIIIFIYNLLIFDYRRCPKYLRNLSTLFNIRYRMFIYILYNTEAYTYYANIVNKVLVNYLRKKYMSSCTIINFN